MAEYIEREALLKEDFTDSFVDVYDVKIFEHIIETAPAADVVEVRHGVWIYDTNGNDWGIGAWVCSLCHNKNDNLGIGRGINPYMFAGSKWCPQCGAKMDGKGDSND